MSRRVRPAPPACGLPGNTHCPHQLSPPFGAAGTPEHPTAIAAAHFCCQCGAAKLVVQGMSDPGGHGPFLSFIPASMLLLPNAAVKH